MARLVGRDAELRTLVELAGRPPCVAIVTGEPGIGTSRLVGEAVQAVERGGVRVLRGITHAVGEALPFGPVVSALRRLHELRVLRPLSPAAGAVRPLVPEISHLLPPALGDGGGMSRHVQLRGLREVVAAACPAMLVAEDVQGCDTATVDFLRFLVAEMPKRLALVITHRSNDVGSFPALTAAVARCGPGVLTARIDLRPLDAAEVAELAGELLGGRSVSTDAGLRLHERTGGVPFAVEELVRLIVDRRGAARGGVAPAREPAGLRDADVDGAAAPWTVGETVLARLADLPPASRRLVEAAAVLGVPACVDELHAVAGVARGVDARALRGALVSGLLVEDADGRCRVRHELAGDAVHASLPVAERSVRHRRAARTLEPVRPRPHARLARHHREAGQPARWAAAAEAAADAAMTGLDHGAAVRLLCDVVELPHLPARTRVRLALKLGRAARHVPSESGGAVARLTAVVAAPRLPAIVRGEVRHLLGDLLLETGDRGAARRHWRSAASELEGSVDLHCHTLLALARPSGLVGSLDEHSAWLEAALSELPRVTDPRVRVEGALVRAELLLCAGDGDGWNAARSIPWGDGSPGVQAHLMWAALDLSAPCRQLGEYDRARAYLDDSAARAARLDHRPMTTFVEICRLGLDWAVGSWEGLEERTARLAAIAPDLPAAHTQIARVRGHLALARGDLSAAEVHLRAAAGHARAGGTVPGVAAVAAGLAWVRLLQGDAGGAAQEAMAGVDAVREKGIWAWAAEVAPAAVTALLAGGGTSEATRLVDDMAIGLAGRRAPLAEAALAACRAQLAEAAGSSAASHLLEQAGRAYASLPRPYEAARMTAAAGFAAHARGDGRAPALLAGAAQAFAALGASGDGERLRRRCRRLGIRLPPLGRRGRPGCGPALTPRQREVAALAADGCTNREIAARLGLSPRTVEHHLVDAMHKIGVPTRTVLARRWLATTAEAAAPPDESSAGRRAAAV